MTQEIVSTVLEWLVEPSGECDRAKLIEVMNRCRERFYLMYPDIPLFYISECFRLQRFPLTCDGPSDCFDGVTLPREYQTIEALWYNEHPVELRSEWREYSQGIAGECDCGLTKYDVPGRVSTFADIQPGRARRLKVVALDPADRGKKVTVRGRLLQGVQVVREIALSIDGVLTDDYFSSIAREGGFVKPRTVGRVALAEEDGRLLSLYEPDETVPGYRRIKITGMRDGCNQVNVRAARQYFPLWSDSDVVETSNRTAFEEMARFLRINSKQNMSAEDLRGAAWHAGQAKAALGAAKAREIGKATQTDVVVRAPLQNPRRLGIGPYYRR